MKSREVRQLADGSSTTSYVRLSGSVAVNMQDAIVDWTFSDFGIDTSINNPAMAGAFGNCIAEPLFPKMRREMEKVAT